MKSTLFSCLMLFFWLQTAHAQQGYPNYYKMLDILQKADSLIKINAYNKAAEAYLEATNIKLEEGTYYDYASLYYAAAGCYALAGQKDKALQHLEYIAKEKDFSEHKQLTEDESFVSLHGHKRWTPILTKIKLNEEQKIQKKQRYEERTSYKGNSEEVIFMPNSAYAQKFLNNDSLPLISVSYGNFRLHFRGNSYAAQHLPEIKADLDAAMHRILYVCDTPKYIGGINLILPESAAEMKELSGFYIHGGLALPGEQIVFIIYGASRRPQFKHEIFHYISNELWGMNASRVLQEGGAFYTDNQCYYENAIYGINAYLLREGKTLALDNIIENFDAIAKDNEVLIYIQSAGVFKYLRETYGAEKLKIIWQKGFAAFEAVYGKSISDFEKEWRDFIAKMPVPEKVDWELLKKNGCG